MRKSPSSSGFYQGNAHPDLHQERQSYENELQLRNSARFYRHQAVQKGSNSSEFPQIPRSPPFGYPPETHRFYPGGDFHPHSPKGNPASRDQILYPLNQHGHREYALGPEGIHFSYPRGYPMPTLSSKIQFTGHNRPHPSSPAPDEISVNRHNHRHPSVNGENKLQTIPVSQMKITKNPHNERDNVNKPPFYINGTDPSFESNAYTPNHSSYFDRRVHDIPLPGYSSIHHADSNEVPYYQYFLYSRSRHGELRRGEQLSHNLSYYGNGKPYGPSIDQMRFAVDHESRSSNGGREPQNPREISTNGNKIKNSYPHQRAYNEQTHPNKVFNGEQYGNHHILGETFPYGGSRNENHEEKAGNARMSKNWYISAMPPPPHMMMIVGSNKNLRMPNTNGHIFDGGSGKVVHGYEHSFPKEVLSSRIETRKAEADRITKKRRLTVPILSPSRNINDGNEGTQSTNSDPGTQNKGKHKPGKELNPVNDWTTIAGQTPKSKKAKNEVKPTNNSTNENGNEKKKEKAKSSKPKQKKTKNGNEKAKETKAKETKAKKQKSSKYRGVCWHKRYNSYVSRISVNGKCKHLGLFADEAVAALTVDKHLIQIYGEGKCKNKLNFPDPNERERLIKLIKAEANSKISEKTSDAARTDKSPSNGVSGKIKPDSLSTGNAKGEPDVSINKLTNNI